MRTRVHVDERPRMESTSTSSTARRLAISVCLAFHRSRPANAAPLSGEFATVISGIFTRDFFVAVFFVADFARDGITRGLAFHLAEVRGPGRVGDTGGFV